MVELCPYLTDRMTLESRVTRVYLPLLNIPGWYMKLKPLWGSFRPKGA